MLSRVPSKHPVIFISDIKLNVLKALLQYIYLGEVQVAKSDLLDFMRAAETFKVKGLQNEENVYTVTDDVVEEVRPVMKKQKTRHPDTQTILIPGPSAAVSAVPTMDMEIGSMFEIKQDMDETTVDSEMTETLRAYLRNSEEGPAIFDEFNLNGLLTEERKEELLCLVCNFVKETTTESTYNKKTRETVAEAVLGLFPSVFGETYEQFGELIRRRIGNSVGIDQAREVKPFEILLQTFYLKIFVFF